MAALSFSEYKSGRTSLLIDNSWKTGLDNAENQIKVIHDELDNPDNQTTPQLLRIVKLVKKQEADLSRNLPSMQRLKNELESVGKNCLAAKITPYIERAEALQQQLALQRKSIREKISTIAAASMGA